MGWLESCFFVPFIFVLDSSNNDPGVSHSNQTKPKHLIPANQTKNQHADKTKPNQTSRRFSQSEQCGPEQCHCLALRAATHNTHTHAARAHALAIHSLNSAEWAVARFGPLRASTTSHAVARNWIEGADVAPSRNNLPRIDKSHLFVTEHDSTGTTGPERDARPAPSNPTPKHACSTRIS